MTTNRRCVTRICSRRATVSAIVTSSLRAGTRNTHRNCASSAVAVGRRCSLPPRIDRLSTSPSWITLRMRATKNRTWMGHGSPEKGSISASRSHIEGS